MKLKKFFTPVQSMEADAARDYIARHKEGDYLILDVRQPGEYEQAHIPGAWLMPLPDLANSYRDLDPEQPTLVYCAVGGRSRVAAQLLSGLGFKEVYNLAGGIRAYRGEKAAGPVELNLDLVRGDETAAEIIGLAVSMERGLQTFYETMAARSPDQELVRLFQELAGIEIRHRQRLEKLVPGGPPAGSEAAGRRPILEGGFAMDEFIRQNEGHLNTALQVLELAMMVETQALDLYLRFAGRVSDPQAREVLYGIADEEKSHLASLARLLEAKLQ